MITHTYYLLSGTGYRYTMHLDRPRHAQGNTYSVFVTLTGFIHALRPETHLPSLSAWGKHDFDAQANLEGEMRAWLVQREEHLR